MDTHYYCYDCSDEGEEEGEENQTCSIYTHAQTYAGLPYGFSSSLHVEI